MALIGTIRKNFWLVLILLGLALAAFIIMDMTSAGSAGGVANSLTLAEVDGEEIDYREFQQTEQSYYSGSGEDVFAKRKTIWDFYLENAVLQKTADELGLYVGSEELIELQFGPNPSEIVKSNWRNPETGQLDRATLQQIRTTIESGEPMDPRFRTYWAEQEKHIIKATLENKLYNLISNAVYTPAWMAEKHFELENTTVDFNYVKIPYDQIDASDLELTDADFKSYLEENRDEFENKEESRSVSYVVFDVVPTNEDSMKIKNRLKELNNEFAATDNDSIFVSINNGNYTHLYSELEDIPEDLRDSIAALEIGSIYGPVESNGYYLSAKLLDKRVIPDSVSARHILIRASQDDTASLAAARAMIDSLRTEITSGRSEFDSLAIKHSADTQSGAQGGDLGTFSQEKMLPEFMKIAFVEGEEGGLYTTTTQYGVHLIKIEEQIYNDRDPKYRIASIGLPIKPGQETQDNRYDDVADIAAQATSLESLEEIVDTMEGVSIEKASGLKINDFSLGDLGSGQTSREIIRWAFESSTEVGDLSPEVYTYSDPVNYYDSKYVIAGLSGITKAGLPPVEDVRSEIETAVLNQKKGEKIKSSLNVTSLEAVADQYGVEVETATEVAMTNRFIPGMGNEPGVIGRAFTLAPQTVSEPIVGESGVYIIKPLSKQQAGVATNIPFLKNSVSTATRSQVNFKIIENMKDRAKLKDDRYKFF